MNKFKLWILSLSLVFYLKCANNYNQEDHNNIDDIQIQQVQQVPININQQVIQAIEKNNIDQMRDCIEAGANINVCTPLGFPIIASEFLNLSPQMLELLLSHPDMDVNAYIFAKNTLLMLVCPLIKSGSGKLVAKLLSHKNTDLNILNEEGQTALQIAQDYENEEIINLINCYQNLYLPYMEEYKKARRLILKGEKSHLIPHALLGQIEHFSEISFEEFYANKELMEKLGFERKQRLEQSFQ